MAEDNKRLIWSLDLDTTQFDDKLSQKGKDILKLNAQELKAKEKTLGVLEKIVLQYELLGKAKGLDPSQAAAVNVELKKIEKQYQAIQKAATTPKGKSQDPLSGDNGKKAAKVIQDQQKAYERFGKVASGRIAEVAEEVIKLSKSGNALSLPDQYASELGKAEEAATALKIATAELRKENRDLLKTGKELTTEEQARLEQNAKAIAENENLTKKLGLAVRRLKDSYSTIDSANDSLEAQQAVIKRLQVQYRALGKEAQESAGGQELQQQIKELTEAYDEQNQSIGRFEQNIGNYKSAVIDAAKTTEGFGTTVGGTIKGIGNASKVLLANPIFLLATVLAGVVALIGKAVANSERGSALLTKAFNAVNAVFLVLTRTVDKALGALENFSFDSIKEGFSSLGSTIQNAVINRINGLLSVLGNIRKGEFKKAGEEALELAKSMNVVAIAVNGVAGAMSDASKEIDETTRALNALYDLEKEVTKANAALTVELAKQTGEVERLTQAADNDTKAWGEREAAARAAGVAIEAQSQSQIEIAKNNLSVIQTQFDLAAGTKQQIELEQELADAKAALIEAEAAQIVNRQDNNERLAKIISDRLEIELDVFLDNFDNIKGINEQLIADETLTLEARKKILEDTKALSDQAFEQQLSVLQQTTGETIDANEFIKASNSAVFLARLRELEVSEKFETRALEVFRDRRSAIQDLAQAEKDLLAAEKARRAESAKNVADAARTTAELTEEIETRRLQFIKASQKAETANAERENRLQVADIENKYEQFRQAAREQADADLFPREKLDEYLLALDRLEDKAKEVQALALERSIFEINQRALEQGLISVQRITSETISTEIDRVAAEQIAELTQQYQQGEIKYEEYQKRLTEISKKASIDRQREELKSLELQLSELQSRISATNAKSEGLQIFDPEKILSDEDLEKAKKEVERLKTEIAKAGAEIEQELITPPDPDLETPLQKVLNYYSLIQDAAFDAWSRVTAAEIEALDRSLSVQEQRIETAKEFFRKGNEDYLEQEENRQRELEQRRERAVRRQQAIDKASQVSSILTGLLSEFASGGLTKAGAALAGISALIAVVSALVPTPQNFNKGTRFVEGEAGIDKIPANLTRGERVTPADQNKKYMAVYDELDKGNIAPKDALQRLKSPIPQYNYDRIGKVVSVESRSTAELEKKMGQMIEQQAQTTEAIAALKMSVKLDAEGFAAYQRTIARRKKASRL